MARDNTDRMPDADSSSLANAPNFPSERTRLMRDTKPRREPEPIDTDFEEIETDDGGVIVRFGGPELLDDEEDEAADLGEQQAREAFYGNLAEHMDERDLAAIAEELYEGVETDIQKRQVWMANYERGISLLGIEVKQPKSEATGEGVSQVDHPLLLDACIGGASNALGEMLPAAGPVKIDNSGGNNAITDKQAMKLEKAFNSFLTDKSPEYYPDTDRMFFQWFFGGMGYKKIFHCPLRRRVVSDAIPPGDFIISNDAASVDNCGRKTHRSKMRQSVMKRMQYLSEYRDVDLQAPTDDTTLVERKIDAVHGIQPGSDRVEDTEYTIYETMVDMVIPGDEHKENGKETGLPRPYIVTFDRDSRVVLSIKRNWVMDDDTFTERRRVVAYHLIPMFGFLASGLVNVLANSTTALTAAWRIMLDNGMFANFPGFLYALNGDRQRDNNFRVGPGEGAPVDIGGADDIGKAIMPLPFKEFGPSFPAFVNSVQEQAAQVGGRANMPIAEGSAQAPVGTTLAALEQASMMISAIHKRGHKSQSLEFQTMLELIREDPEGFVRLFATDDDPWEVDELLEALDNYRLVPKADPNTPTQMHRLLKGQALKQMADGSPERYDADKVDTYILELLGFEDPQQFFSTPEQRQAAAAAQANGGADPSLAVAAKVAETKIADTQAKVGIAKESNVVKLEEIRSREAIAQMQAELKRQELASREQIEAEKLTQSGALELYKADNEMARAESDAARQQEQADADREFQAGESAASRDNAVQLAKMKPKPAPGGGKPKAKGK